MPICACTFHRIKNHELQEPLRVDEKRRLTVALAKEQGIQEGEEFFRRNVGTAGGTFIRLTDGKFVIVSEVNVCGNFRQDELDAAAKAEGLSIP